MAVFQKGAKERPAAQAAWDLSDLVIGGATGRNAFLKNAAADCAIIEEKEILQELWQACQAKAYPKDRDDTRPEDRRPALEDFSIGYNDVKHGVRVRFRVSVQDTVGGIYYCMRKISGVVPTLARQGHMEENIGLMLKHDRRGLILIGGEMGSGKTTTASAVVKETLERFGGTAITVEDPPEYSLQGPHVGADAAGFCMQKSIVTREIASEIPKLMRAAAPDIIMIGEIRDRDMAREVILAASNGHRIISTIHGKGIDGMLQRLTSLAATPEMGMDAVAGVVAGALSLAVYQELERKDGCKVLKTRVLDLGDENRQAIAASLSKKEFTKAQQYFKPQTGFSQRESQIED
jgi:twitching motility protein PilT